MARPPSPSLAALLPLLLASPAAAGPATVAPSAAAAPATAAEADGTVAAILDGDSLVLADGRRVRLVGIDAPEPPPDDGMTAAGTPAAAARAALTALAAGRRVALAVGDRPRDRYGRVLAQARTEDGIWLQGELLRRGLVRVHSFADNRAMVPQMLAIEAEARAAGRGLWALPAYRVLTPRQAAGAIDSFQLVEGRVTAVSRHGGRTYVDFGADWRTDLSLALDARAQRLCQAVGLALDRLPGRRVRVRGWLRLANGPLIEITHPEQIELLAP